MSVEADAISNQRIEQEINDRKKCKLSTYDEKNESLKDESNLLSYDTLRIIFSYLPAIDLCHCSQVCKLWRDVATFELSIRKVIIGSGNYEDLIEKHAVNRIFERSIRNKPMLNLVFISKDGVLDNIGDNRVFFGFEKYCPKNCFSIGINVPGLVVENEEYEENKCLSSYFLLPDDPSVHINMINAYMTATYVFKREKNEIIHQKQNKNEEDTNLSEIFEKGISGLENPECVILFSCDNDFYDAHMLNKMNLRGVKSVWGGVVEDMDAIYEYSGIKDCTLWLALVISGKYVKSWSTFLDKNVVHEKDIRSKLMKLKDNLQLYKHTIGFMFSCIGRGAHWYNCRKNVESSIFKSIFPNIPLIGCFGNGEFGNCNVNANPKYNMKRDGIYRQYSTSFMILTYGKIDENLEIDDYN